MPAFLHMPKKSDFERQATNRLSVFLTFLALIFIIALIAGKACHG